MNYTKLRYSFKPGGKTKSSRGTYRSISTGVTHGNGSKVRSGKSGWDFRPLTIPKRHQNPCGWARMKTARW